MEVLVQVFINELWDVLCIKLLFEAFLDRKNRKYSWAFGSCLYVCLVAVTLFCYKFPVVKIMLFVLSVFLCSQLFFNGKLWCKAVLSIVYPALAGGIDFIALGILRMVLPDLVLTQVTMAFSIALVAVCRILTMVFMLVLHKIFRKNNSYLVLSWQEWVMLGLVPLFSCTVIICVCASILYPAVMDKMLIVIALGMFLLNPFVFGLLIYMSKKNQKLKEQMLLLQQAKAQFHSYEGMREEYKRERKVVHDFGNQLFYIQGMLQKQSKEKVAAYIEDLSGTIVKQTRVISTNHPCIDTVINSKYQYAQSRNIHMVLNLQNLETVSVEEHDLVVLLSNLIDNATEACEKLQEQRVIKVYSDMQEEMWFFCISNPMGEELLIKEGQIISTKLEKEQHGIGLGNVIEIIKKYGGTYTIAAEHGKFEFSMLI